MVLFQGPGFSFVVVANKASVKMDLNLETGRLVFMDLNGEV